MKEDESNGPSGYGSNGLWEWVLLQRGSSRKAWLEKAWRCESPGEGSQAVRTARGELMARLRDSESLTEIKIIQLTMAWINSNTDF